MSVRIKYITVGTNPSGPGPGEGPDFALLSLSGTQCDGLMRWLGHLNTWSLNGAAASGGLGVAWRKSGIWF